VRTSVVGTREEKGEEGRGPARKEVAPLTGLSPTAMGEVSSRS